MMRVFRFFFLLSLSGMLSCSSLRNAGTEKRDVSPYDFGLAEAKTGIDRYLVLRKTHIAAMSAGVNVDYSGIDSLDIEIPAEFRRIPLTQYNDFKGCVLTVKNTSGKGWLFYVSQKETPVEVDKRLIDKGDFRTVPELSRGKHLLLIEDEKPWVLNRKGHDYGHQRKDILLVHDGKSKNHTTMPYDNENSSPKCTYIPVKEKPFVVKNLTVKRDPSCTFVTYLFYVSGYDDVQFSSVSIYTPENKLTGDSAIRVFNSTNVTFTNIHIEGTYSQPDYSGYGFSLGNVWNFKGKGLYGNGNWGVFGTNNVNTAHIEDSQINRFDIHCYGRDLSYDRVAFFDRFNSHSSVFGTITYNNCTFTNFVPSQFGGSYNAFVAHDVEFNDCVFNLAPQKNYLFRPLYVTKEINDRAELAKKCLPNIRIRNLTVNMPEGINDFYIISILKKDEFECAFDWISEISIDGLTINANPDSPIKTVQLCNRPIETVNDVSFSIRNAVINQPQRILTKTGVHNEALLRFNIPIKKENVHVSKIQNLKLESK